MIISSIGYTIINISRKIGHSKIGADYWTFIVKNFRLRLKNLKSNFQKIRSDINKKNIDNE